MSRTDGLRPRGQAYARFRGERTVCRVPRHGVPVSSVSKAVELALIAVSERVAELDQVLIRGSITVARPAGHAGLRTTEVGQIGVVYFDRRLFHTRGWRRTWTQPSTMSSFPSTTLSTAAEF